MKNEWNMDEIMNEKYANMDASYGWHIGRNLLDDFFNEPRMNIQMKLGWNLNWYKIWAQYCDDTCQLFKSQIIIHVVACGQSNICMSYNQKAFDVY
jgi:hypothetical protein